jgi:hypothetical protein
MSREGNLFQAAIATPRGIAKGRNRSRPFEGLVLDSFDIGGFAS